MAQVKEMPLSEKLQLMEMLWDDLSQNPDGVQSPEWHAREVEATDERRAKGLEEPLDWEESKRLLLSR